MLTTRTQSGVEVTLEGVEYCGRPAVRCRLTHPQLGPIDFPAGDFGSPAKRTDVRGILGWHGGQQVCLTVPEADYRAALAEARAIGERELADLRSGAVPVRLRWQEGSPLSGHTPESQRAADLLCELGLAEAVGGWGYLVPREVVERLGEEFTMARAEELARARAVLKAAGRPLGFAVEVGGQTFPGRAARGVVADALEEAGRGDEAQLLRGAGEVHLAAGRLVTTAEALALAARTGERVLLRQDAEECDGSQDECDLDVVYEWALPDGSTQVERVHTH